MQLSNITEQQESFEASEVILSTLILETFTTDVEQNDSVSYNMDSWYIHTRTTNNYNFMLTTIQFALTESFLSVVDNILEVDVEVLQMSQEQSNTSAR